MIDGLFEENVRLQLPAVTRDLENIETHQL